MMVESVMSKVYIDNNQLKILKLALSSYPIEDFLDILSPKFLIILKNKDYLLPIIKEDLVFLISETVDDRVQ